MPVRKPTGFVTMVSESQDKSFIYSFLEEFKTNPSTAGPFLAVTFFDELQFKKGITLVRFDIIRDLSKEEAETLFQLTTDFYTREHLYESVRHFNHNQSKFDISRHMEFCLGYYNKE